MATLAEILEDKKTYPDDQKITISGVETTLGDLRSGYMKDADYRKKTTAIAEARRDLDRRQADFEAARLDAEAKLEAMAAKIIRRDPDTTDTELQGRLEADPVAKRLMDMVTGLTSKIETLNKEVETTKTTLAQGKRQALVDQHRRVLSLLRQHDPNLDEQALVQFAKDNFIPRLDIAYRVMTEETRTQAAVKTATEKAKKEGLEEGKKLGAQPIIPARKAAAKLPYNAPKTVDEAFEAAQNDPEILAIMTGGQEA